MAKSKAARAALHTKHVKKKAKSVGANRFSTLALEEPFPFLKLPGELRDAILDLVIATEVEASGSSATVSFNIEDARTSRALSQWSPKRRGPNQLRTVPSLLLVSKQVHREVESAMSRTMPFHVRAEMIHYERPKDITRVVFRDKLLSAFPISLRRLNLKNASPFPHTCRLGRDIIQTQLLDSPSFAGLQDYLRSCTTLNELVIDWCSARRHDRHALGSTSTMLIHAFIELVESLRLLQKYNIKVCRWAVYARRAKGQTWDDTGVFREGTGAPLPEGEWKDFSSRMGTNYYDWVIGDW